MVITLIVTIPIIAFLSSYMTLKAYRLGLTHNYNLKHDIEPIKESNPIENIFKTKEEEKPQDTMQLINEWLNGEEKHKI